MNACSAVAWHIVQGVPLPCVLYWQMWTPHSLYDPALEKWFEDRWMNGSHEESGTEGMVVKDLA